MREAILLALVAGLLYWLIDPLLGSFLRGFVGYILSKTLGNLLPRSVRGIWQATFAKGDAQHVECAKVEQMVDRVFGEIEFGEDNKKYRFYGTIRGDILVATYDLRRHPQAMDRGAFTLKLNNDGKEMVGTYSWTDDKTARVNSDSYVWTKISD